MQAERPKETFVLGVSCCLTVTENKLDLFFICIFHFFIFLFLIVVQVVAGYS